MKLLAIPSEEEFDSFPPALRRKFFSNVERFRMRLAHSDPDHVLDYQFNTSPSSAPRCLHFRTFRSRPSSVAKPFSSKRRRRLEKPLFNYPPSFSYVPHKRSKPGSLKVAYLATQADSQCFHSLPPKVQQKHFSREEQLRLRQVYCESVILDAADETLYRLEQKERRPRWSSESLPSETTTPFSQSSTLYLSDSDSESEDEMDDSLYDSFRWLDEDGDLDLTLDEYHAHVVNTTSKPAPRRMPSFRRTLSFNSNNLARKPMASIAHRRIPASSQSSNVPSSLANIIGRTSTTSRPSSSHRQVQHAPRSSTSSIDPSAQYYQDPEARLKLRVYLASPQKFDEAIEFGFPAVENNKENLPLESPEIIVPGSTPNPQEYTGTFFKEEDEISVGGDKEGKTQSVISRLSPIAKEFPSPTNATFLGNKRHSSMPTPKPGPHRIPGNREMTLKMTLTRPDLRTESPSVSPSSAEDPLKLADLPPASSSPYTWELDTDDQSIMKKMWRKFRKRC
ncbi:hypothetical protein ASPWEDRAFT_303367 [Aspergillus wentii DTO 134E9]|uniref:Uncharacterized protein n=1 Tax=Aspergillus wentii DTO 134E9 TaxID=1073089 RepID=A0A1L9R563_ASPWE|nr:uncharacterized protein ASPWEDRAFT_303367 [Aspergillus wentii DTO 134E9]KAI9927315.1 hypothetical protein MW887_003702 [Aspergillus wentii]OJJ30044.1 hypothetical protein ASPWEDRAFT_303367 [Aspergillus wentii DTO 134E9]